MGVPMLGPSDIVRCDGASLRFGDAAHLGSGANIRLNAPMDNEGD